MNSKEAKDPSKVSPTPSNTSERDGAQENYFSDAKKINMGKIMGDSEDENISGFDSDSEDENHQLGNGEPSRLNLESFLK